VICTFVSVYYLAKYKYFAFIFSQKRQILYLVDFVNVYRPLGLAQFPMFFIHCYLAGFSFRKLASVGVKALLNL